ncbi:MAG: pilus assembly protein [Lachnospiraceae bacterium]|nr:pilus assembly protein [Lachnospiraceae bacterium]
MRHIHSNRGMTTIEAAYLIPVSLAVTWMIIWCGILLYDRTAAEYAAAASVIYASEFSELDNRNLSAFASEKCGAMLEGRMILADDVEASFEVSGLKINSSLTSGLTLPGIPLKTGVGTGGRYDISSKAEAPRLNCSRTVRSIYRIRELMNKKEENNDGSQ